MLSKRIGRMAKMFNLLKAELFKLRKRWMPYVLLLVLLSTVLLPVVINYINYNDILSNNPELANIEITVNPDGSTTISGLPPFEPDSRFDTTYMYAQQLVRLKKSLVLPGAMESVFDSIPNLGMFLVIVLAASIIGNEYGWGTVRQAIGRGNSRASYLASKVLTSTITAVAGVIVVVAVGLIATIITSLLVEGSIAWEGFASYFFISLGASLLVIMVYIALATFFAVLLRSAMAGMAVAVAWFIGESIVMALLIMSTGWLADLNVYLLSYNTGQLLSYTLGGDFTTDMWKAVGLLVLYSGIFLAGSYGVFRRQDLTA
jgi:ABC-2 type transport system permease protein